jgi:protoporphyrinogen oxidase
MSELVVVGAGPAGLTAAWRAALAGHDVRVIDAAPAIGGMAASVDVAGQRVVLGSHRLHPATPPHLLAALSDLLGDDLQTRPRHGRLHLRNRWIGFPLRPGELLRRLPPGFAAAALRDALAKPLRQARADTFGEVVRAGLGPAMLREFYGPYATKLWGLDPGELAGDLARRRIAASSPASMLRKVIRGARPGARTFLYPRLGYGQIVEALANAAVAAGCEITVATPVERVAWHDDRVVVSGPDLSVDAARLVWTAPLGNLAGAAGAPAPVLDASRRLRHRAMVLVYLVAEQGRYTEYDAHYVPDASVSLTRLSEPKNYRDGPDPPDRTVLCAEVPCAVGDARWTESPVDAGARVVDALVRLGLPAPQVVDVEIRRLPAVYPVLTPAAAVDLAAVDAWANERPRTTVLGRQGLFVADNLHHVMDMGWSAAAALGADGSIEADRWARERARFASFVVED